MNLLAPVLYFLMGVAVTVLWAMVSSSKEREQAARDRRPWTSVSNLRWSWDFDFSFEHERTALDIARDVARFAAAQVENDRDRITLEAVRVVPGDYTVRMGLTASFVRRDPST